MSNYKLTRYKSKWLLQHIYGPHIYSKSFKYKFMAHISKFFKDIRGF